MRIAGGDLPTLLRSIRDVLFSYPDDTVVWSGHGEPMDREQFGTWRAAFDALLDCAASANDVAGCVAGWRRGAATFIPAGDEARIDEFTAYYVTEILRSRDARDRFCKPLGAD